MSPEPLHDLFARELTDVHAAERQALRVLETMREEARDPEMARALERHLAETRAHLRRIDEARRALAPLCVHGGDHATDAASRA